MKFSPYPFLQSQPEDCEDNILSISCNAASLKQELKVK